MIFGQDYQLLYIFYFEGKYYMISWFYWRRMSVRLAIVPMVAYETWEIGQLLGGN